MLYFIGYTLPKDAREAHEAETKILTDKFGILPLHERSVPHLTFKSPFEFEKVEFVADQLEEFCKNQKAGNIKIDGYIYLNDRTIGWKAVPDEDAVLFVKNLTEFISKIPGMPKDDRANREETLHASVARFLTPEKAEEILKYLNSMPKPQYDMKLDSVSVYHQVDKKWQELTVIPVGK